MMVASAGIYESAVGFHLEEARRRYLSFLWKCRAPDGAFSLTPDADSSAYAACFWVFGMHLLCQREILVESRSELAASIRQAVRNARAMNAASNALGGKAYRQLLAFVLSALSVLDSLVDDPLEDLVKEQLPASVEQELTRYECLLGRAQSGNQAMFTAVFLLYARDVLGMDIGDRLDTWVRLHLAAMNRFGFWGSNGAMTILQFQNGYHQYEILEYMGISSGKEAAAAKAVAHMADAQGHFAPYPGGGGCFDYDAVFMLTLQGKVPDSRVAHLLQGTASTLLSEQQADGGFCESLYVRPRSAAKLLRTARHVLAALPNLPATVERGRYALALQRSRYDRIATHWSAYSRRWDESNLWDSWFRMLALARIECAMDPEAAVRWGFIKFPGIGYHPALNGTR
jgi:hypothetical protein